MMKNLVQKTLFAATLLLMVSACKKEETKIFLEGGSNPQLSANKTGTISMAYATGSSEAVTLYWTNPEYAFTTGVSSQNVTYNLEVDTAGANFTNPLKKTVVISKDLSFYITQNMLNDYLLNQLNLQADIPHDIEMRVIASINNSEATKRISNVLKYSVTPYSTPPKVEPPTAGTLWIVGDATYNGWDNPVKPEYSAQQQFTKISNTLYELTLELKGNGGYKLIQKPGEWSTQYHMLAGGTWQGGDFEKKDSDPQFPGPPDKANYKITVDFQKGKFSVVKL